MIILGVDPGLTGGLAMIESGRSPRLLIATDVPTHLQGAKKRVVASAMLAFLQRYKPAYGFIERAQSMPKDGNSSAFIYGRTVGYLECCIDGMGIPLRFIESSSWKTTHGLIGTGKKESRARAITLFGPEFFPLAEHHNRAEAALIAYHGMMALRLKNLPTIPTRSGEKKIQ